MPVALVLDLGASKWTTRRRLGLGGTSPTVGGGAPGQVQAGSTKSRELLSRCVQFARARRASSQLSAATILARWLSCLIEHRYQIKTNYLNIIQFHVLCGNRDHDNITMVVILSY